MFYDLWAAMFVIFSVHVFTCVEGWMIENAEFYRIFVHYQYADCFKAQYEPNMHTKRSCYTENSTLLSQASYICHCIVKAKKRTMQCHCTAVQAPHQVAACVTECRQPSREEHRCRD